MIPTLKQSIKNIRNHYFLLILSSLIDILFFYSLTRLHVETFRLASTHIKSAQKIIESQMAKLTQVQYTQLDQILMSNADFALQYKEITKYIGLFLLGLFATWFLLRGTNWLIAHKISESKISIKEFIERFTFFSTTGFIIFILILLIYGMLLNYATFNPLPLINAKMANAVFAIMLILLYYFLSTAFALPAKSKFRNVTTAITNAKKIAPVFITSMITLSILIIVPALLMKNYYWAGLLTSVLITIPLMTLARIYLISACKP